MDIECRYLSHTHTLVLQIQISADYQPRIQIVDFQNPRNMLANGSCCSNFSTQMSNCPDVCDELVSVCFRSTDHPVDDMENCPLFEMGDIVGLQPRGLIFGTIHEPWTGVRYILATVEQLPLNYHISCFSVPLYHKSSIAFSSYLIIARLAKFDSQSLPLSLADNIVMKTLRC